MKALPACVLVCLILGTTHASADVDIRQKQIRFQSEAPPVKGAAFDRTLELEGIRFRVSSANEGSISALHIVPGGLEIDNSPIVRTIDGTVTGAEAADLNADGIHERRDQAGGCVHDASHSRFVRSIALPEL